MSNGRKLKRQMGKKQQTKPRKPLYDIRMIIYDDQSVDVAGFPLSFQHAINCMNLGVEAVAGIFVQEAAAGRVDEKGFLIEQADTPDAPAALASEAPAPEEEQTPDNLVTQQEAPLDPAA